jgi:hypothetical protein
LLTPRRSPSQSRADRAQRRGARVRTAKGRARIAQDGLGSMRTSAHPFALGRSIPLPGPWLWKVAKDAKSAKDAKATGGRHGGNEGGVQRRGAVSGGITQISHQAAVSIGASG